MKIEFIPRLHLVVLCGLLVWGSHAFAEDGSTLYRLQKGDSLSEIAEVYLGGKEFVPELLAFNNIQNATTVREGSVIALPGKIRDEALMRLQLAEQAVGMALDAQADKYAVHEYKDARTSLEAAKKARFEAAYAKALGMAERTIAIADEAKRVADKNANEEKDGRVVKAFGSVEISEDGGTSWRSVSQGDPLPLTAIVRTDAKSRAEVVLEDGSIFQVLEASELSIAQYLRDRRTGRIDAELRVLMGDVMGKIKPKKRDDSRLDIKTGKASIAVRGTRLRAKVDEVGVTRTELLGGKVVLHARGKQVPIPPNYGVVAPPNGYPGDPTELLPPPTPSSAWDQDVTTARQRPFLRWNRVENRRLSGYHVEVAHDPEFTHIVDNAIVAESGYQPSVLPEGDYLWRVSSIDKKKLEGDSCEPRVLRIRKDLGLRLEYHGELVESGGRYVASAGNTYIGVPAQDDTSVAYVEYSIDGGSYKRLTGPVRLPLGAPRTLQMRGVGLDGDVGPEIQSEMYVDGEPPDVSVGVSRRMDDGAGGAWVLVRINAEDLSGLQYVRYTLNGKDVRDYTEPIRLSTLQNYTLTVRAKDRVGNRSAKLSYEFNGELVPRGEQVRLVPHRL